MSSSNKTTRGQGDQNIVTGAQNNTSLPTPFKYSGKKWSVPVTGADKPKQAAGEARNIAVAISNSKLASSSSSNSILSSISPPSSIKTNFKNPFLKQIFERVPNAILDKSIPILNKSIPIVGFILSLAILSLLIFLVYSFKTKDKTIGIFAATSFGISILITIIWIFAVKKYKNKSELYIFLAYWSVLLVLLCITGVILLLIWIFNETTFWSTAIFIGLILIGIFVAYKYFKKYIFTAKFIITTIIALSLVILSYSISKTLGIVIMCLLVIFGLLYTSLSKYITGPLSKITGPLSKYITASFLSKITTALSKYIMDPLSKYIIAPFLVSTYYTQPKIWIILFIELLIIAFYFLVPLLYKYIYTNYNTKIINDPDSDNSDAQKIIQNEDELLKLVEGLNVDWDFIMAEHLYKCENASTLSGYLLNLGYKATNSINGSPADPAKCNKDNDCTSLSISQQKLGGARGNIMNFITYKLGLEWEKKPLEYAMAYIQCNALLISTKKSKIDQLKSDLKLKSKSKLLKTIVLLRDPIYTDSESALDISGNNENKDNIFNYNYAIGAWIFLHEQPPSAKINNNKFTSILNFGNKPNILFNVKDNKLKITMKNNSTDQEIFITDKIKLQRWTYIVVNYEAGTADVFINSELVSSTTNILPFMDGSKITSGSDEGVSGGICNIVYYPNPLGIDEIGLNYKTLKWKNPPVI